MHWRRDIFKMLELFIFNISRFLSIDLKITFIWINYHQLILGKWRKMRIEILKSKHHSDIIQEVFFLLVKRWMFRHVKTCNKELDDCFYFSVLLQVIFHPIQAKYKSIERLMIFSKTYLYFVRTFHINFINQILNNHLVSWSRNWDLLIFFNLSNSLI